MEVNVTSTTKKELSAEGKAYIQKEMKRYETVDSAIIPALYQAQKEYGYISSAVIDELASIMGISARKIHEVNSFYTMFNKKPVGKYHIQVCTNIVCSCVGARETMDYICNKIGVKPDEVSKDGRFMVSAVECLGSCGTAPMAQINDEYHENLTPEKINRLLETLK